KDGGVTNYTATILVVNSAPTADLSIAPPPDGQVIKEGDVITARFTGAADSSLADSAAGLHFSFAQNPADLKSSYATAGTSASASILLLDDGVQVVYGRVFDKDGGFTNVMVTVPVAGVAPAASIFDVAPTTEGTPVTISFTMPSDPSSADTAAG